MSIYERERYAKYREFMNSNKNSFTSNKISKQKHKAIYSRGIEWNLDKDFIHKMMVESEYCALSGRKLIFEIGNKNSPSIDRIDSNKGYEPSNVQIVSFVANQAKNDLTDKEFIELCLDVVRNAGYQVRKP